MVTTARQPYGTYQVLEEGRAALRFERSLDHSPERVWAVLTEPDQLRTWFPAAVALDRPAGTALTFGPTEEQKRRFDLPEPTSPNGEVTRADRPRVLEYTWDDEVLRWELQPEAGGCHLVFTNTFPDRGAAASIAAGWHAGLEVLEAQLNGRPVNWSAWDRAEALNQPYADRFG